MPYHESLHEIQQGRKSAELNDKTANLIEQGRNLIKAAERLRKKHRRHSKRTSPQRRLEMGQMVEEINDLMKPVRSALGTMVWLESDANLNNQLHDISKELQIERAALRRMVEPRLS